MPFVSWVAAATAQVTLTAGEEAIGPVRIAGLIRRGFGFESLVGAGAGCGRDE